MRREDAPSGAAGLCHLGEAREGALDEEAGGDHKRGDGGHGPGGRLRQRPTLLLRRHPAWFPSAPAQLTAGSSGGSRRLHFLLCSARLC